MYLTQAEKLNISNGSMKTCLIRILFLQLNEYFIRNEACIFKYLTSLIRRLVDEFLEKCHADEYIEKYL